MSQQNVYDIIIIGGGPAGLTAAIYAARDKHKVLVIEKNEAGGQIAITQTVENYPGIPSVNGRELGQRMKEQAESFGAEVIYDTVKSLDLTKDIKTVVTDKGSYEAFSVILATGARPRSAGFKGEDKFKGRGVAYCATCDGALFTGCDIYVVGGGLSAVQEAKFLSQFASKLVMLVREESFTCGEHYIKELNRYSNISVRFQTELLEVKGKSYITSLEILDHKTKKQEQIETMAGMPIGVFVFVGQEPDTSWIPEEISRNDQGYLITDACKQTNIPGVCAAGDLCVTPLRQAITAAADGAIAASSLRPYIQDMHTKYDTAPSFDETPPCNEQETALRKPLLKLWLDDSNFSQEIEQFLSEASELKDILIVKVEQTENAPSTLPYIELCFEDGSSTGILFHSVPKGLEWDSFLMALFQISGNPVKISPEDMARIEAITEDLNIKVLTTLTCGNCPGTVMAANQIAALNPHVTAEMFDLTHFRKMRFKYQVMSVPALLLNDKFITTGKMNLTQLLDVIQKSKYKYIK